ncbi:hypothetical protein MBANPS3_008726 [Mucor bainieri]
MSSPNVAKYHQNHHVGSGVGFGGILDGIKVQRGTSLDNITNRDGGPQEFKYDSFPYGYLPGAEEKHVDGIFDCAADRAEWRLSYLEVVEQAPGRDGASDEACQSEQPEEILVGAGDT